jgi:hypothetical protein
MHRVRVVHGELSKKQARSLGDYHRRKRIAI